MTQASEVATTTPQQLPATAPAQDFGQVLLGLLQDPNVSADKLKIVLDAQAINLERQQREQFNIAFARLSAVLPQVTREGVVELVKNGQVMGRYRFARWEDMDRVLRPILAEHGFALSFRSKESTTHVWVQGELSYGGYSKFSEVTLPPDAGPGRNQLQAWGGSISYAKRYTAEMLLNIVRRDVDDDASSLEARITAEQVGELSRLIEETKTDTGKFLTVMVSEIERLEDIRQRDYARVLNALEERKRAQAKKGGKA